jgi:hypothetical protein
LVPGDLTEPLPAGSGIRQTARLARLAASNRRQRRIRTGCLVGSKIGAMSAIIVDRRRALLTAALDFLQLRHQPPELFPLRRWLDSWRGLGDIVRGLNAQGLDLELRQFRGVGGPTSTQPGRPTPSSWLRLGSRRRGERYSGLDGPHSSDRGRNDRRRRVGAPAPEEPTRSAKTACGNSRSGKDRSRPNRAVAQQHAADANGTASAHRTRDTSAGQTTYRIA